MKAGDPLNPMEQQSANRDSAELPAAPLTVDGSFLLHQMFRVRWAAWRGLGSSEQKHILTRASARLACMEQNREQASAFFSLLGHKGELSARENLEFAIGLQGLRAGIDIRGALREVGLAGYDDTPARQLSAGQRKRLALARLWLLPTPLYRYPSARTGVIDGALFAMVSNAGTDPEVLLLIEATETGGKRKWQFACGRFSDWELHVNHNDEEVYTSIRNATTNTFAHDPEHLYRIFPEKIVSLEGKLLARLRQTPTGRELIPATDEKEQP